ncbi:pentapeptide repeat-containing protein [Methyloprofundus sp.]|uniref:pentapeptide repeat-containing protein n=1 Tax=Methyloprofundus sp. TaxID=2020875 RepID=UPI003D0C7BF8
MYFPLIERRIAAQDRRVNTTDRRHSQKSHSLADNKRKKTTRRKGNERRALILDRETLLYASLLNNGHEPKREEQKTKLLPICSAILIPLIIGGFTILATNSINDKQMESAKLIAQQQKESAELIAKGQQKNAQNIAQGEMETEHLKHLVAIFSSIISPDKNDSPEIIQQRIRSLAVYGDEALPFLLQIQHHFSKPENIPLEGKGISVLSNEEKNGLYKIETSRRKSGVAKSTINTIIKHSQLNVPKQKIIGPSDTNRLNLRNKEYIKYNLDDSIFTNVNLYQANFSGSSLRISKFINADLVEANFQYANLSGVTFENAELANTNFNQAKLSGVKFINCKKIENAKFSLNTVLYAKLDFFGSKLSEQQYILLLMNHKEELVNINKNEEEKSKLDSILTILKDKYQIQSFNELQEKFKQYKSKSIASMNKSNNVSQISKNILNAFPPWP